MMNGNGLGWGWMMLMPVIWIGLVAVIIWAVIRLAQPGGNRGQASDSYGGPHHETPLEILDRRFASGEIDVDAYTRAREQLVGHRTSSS